MVGIVTSILEQGFIYGVMAVGVYISYKILDFPDLSVDGTFPLGAALCITVSAAGIDPWLSLILAFLSGCAAGAFTGFLNVGLKIKNLLCGILTMTALYSINYRIAGSSTVFISMTDNTIFSSFSSMLPAHINLYSKLIIMFFITIVSKLLLDWYLRTKSGFLLRSVGDNESLVVTLGKNPGNIKILGLAISNGLVALAGAVNCQYTRQFSVGGGTGTVVMGLAAVIIGATIFKKMRFLKITPSVIIGMIIYKTLTYAAIASGLIATDTNLVITVLFIVILIINNILFKRDKGIGVRPDA